jgi:hypothetical protein
MPEGSKTPLYWKIREEFTAGVRRVTGANESKQSNVPDTFGLWFGRQALPLGQGPVNFDTGGDHPLFAVHEFAFGILGVIDSGDHASFDRG